MTITVTKAETNSTWECGKLKLTLTRKSFPKEDKITIINKDGMTQGDGRGFMWSGSAAAFKDLVTSLGLLHGQVEQELTGTKASEDCSCPIQHALDCQR